MKVVINTCYGGFHLSKRAVDFLGKGWNEYGPKDRILSIRREEWRTNVDLVECIEKLGADGSGTYSKLIIVDIPDDVVFYIEDYDGIETIHETHRVWDGSDACN